MEKPKIVMFESVYFYRAEKAEKGHGFDKRLETL